MTDENDIITLRGGENFITQNDIDSYKVVSGTVLVYIVPLKNGAASRRSFIYQAEQNEIIPGFAYRDIEYREWRFCFAAVDKAELSVIKNGSTKILKERFAKKAAIRNFDKEGYNGGLVDRYRMNTVTEDSFIRRTQRLHSETGQNILSVIFNSFGKNKFAGDREESGDILYDAVSMLCAKQNIPIAPYEKIKQVCGGETTIPGIARVSHFAYREIILEPGWNREDGGSFIAFANDGRPIICFSKGTHSYTLWDAENGCALPNTEKITNSLSPKACMIYPPLPNKPLDRRGLAGYCVKRVRPADAVLLTLLITASALIGILTPSLSQSIYDTYIPLGASNVIFQTGCLLGAFMLSNVMFSIVKNIGILRISSKMSYDMQSAVYDRLFSLPESFFRSFASADLAQRAMSAGTITENLTNTAIAALAALITAAVYFIRMCGYSSALAGAGLALLAVFCAAYYLISAAALKHKAKAAELDGKTSSLMFRFLSGISKIRSAGAEDLAVYEYIKPYARQRGEEQKHNNILNIASAIRLVSCGALPILFYILIIKANAGISLGAFAAFGSLFGAFSSYVFQLADCAVRYRREKTNIARLKPVLDAVPEYDGAKELPGDISGAIEISNVTFSYDSDSPAVLDNISLGIKAGEYVGIVGTSGCGKSTLLKLLLGFEKPDSGKIYYDNKDIESVDKRELRKKMGVVLQDGKLISGSIFENITITAPSATVKDVEKVIEAVGLKNDIEQMPMGLHTVLSEDCASVSGGQQQRILIARAIISNPRILFFDEATSALDNITQAKVCETLEKISSTRIVIAHRLSTIMKCDRIIVLDNGKIAEQGTYDELMKNGGLFCKLASRQTA